MHRHCLVVCRLRQCPMYGCPLPRPRPNRWGRDGDYTMAMKQLVKALLFRPGYTKHRILAGSLRGMWFTFNLRGDTQQWRGIYETALQTWLKAHLRPGGTCMDIGAARGYFTLLAAKLAGPQGHVYAFEPSPLHKHIHAHIAMHNPGWLAPVSVHDSYVVDTAGRGADQITIDQFCETEHLSRLDVVKIDVDGAEVDVLRGMEQ